MNAPLPVIESAVLMPSIGDDVLFHLNGQKLTSPPLVSISGSDLPMHAKVVYVWSPTMVNLVLWDHYGNMHTLTSVKFLPPGEDVPAGQTYCELSVIHGELVEGALYVDTLHKSDLADTVDAPAERRPQTFGQKAVGLQFNPSNQDDVALAKAEAAALIDRAHQLRLNTENPEVKRMASLAITHAQEAQMWLVKAQTWKD